MPYAHYAATTARTPKRVFVRPLIARARFRCRYRNGRYEVPSRTLIRDVLTRVDPVSLDRALQGWNGQYAATDEGLAIDGKTMCNAIEKTICVLA